MNIAIVNVLAKSKSTGKIAFNLYQYLKDEGHNAYIFYGRRDEAVCDGEADMFRVGSNAALYSHAACSRLLGGEGIYSRRATKNMIKQLDRLNIEAVCLLNIHGYYLNFPMLFDYLGRKNIRVVYVMLDEYPMMGKCPYSYDCDKFLTECSDCPQVGTYPKSLFFDRSNMMFRLKKEAYDKVPDCTFMAIQYTIDRAKRSALLGGRRLAVADEAVDLRNLYYPRETERLRNELGIPAGNKVILTVSVYTDPRKGGKYFLEAARRLEDRTDITFVYVGFTADKAVCPKNMIAIGYVKSQEALAEYYSLGDLFVHTSTAETIPSAILEALSCGTPVLGFNTSGIPSSADAAHGTFVEPCNVDEMARVILDTPLKTKEIIASCRSYAESRYDAVEYCKKLKMMLTEGETK